MRFRFGIVTKIFIQLVLMPEKGTGVWIEFEQGDPDRPIWTGGYLKFSFSVFLMLYQGNFKHQDSLGRRPPLLSCTGDTLRKQEAGVNKMWFGVGLLLLTKDILSI